MQLSVWRPLETQAKITVSFSLGPGHEEERKEGESLLFESGLKAVVAQCFAQGHTASQQQMQE